MGWGGADLVRRATGLGAFAAVVTLAVHVPGGLARPVFVESEALWLWDILQRTNLVKKRLLVGGLFSLFTPSAGQIQSSAVSGE